MVALPASEFSHLSWLSEDPYGEYTEIDKKRLIESCIQELLHDTSLLTSYIPRLPKQIHSMILSSAIAQNKDLVVTELMKCCPYETIALPVPNVLKSLHAIPHTVDHTEIANAREDFTRLAARMFSVFFELIENNNTDSQLRCLDFCNIPVGFYVFTLLKDFLSRTTKVLSREYTLKCAAFVGKSTDVCMLTTCIEKANAIGLKLVITGVFFLYNYFPDITVINLLEHLNELDVELVVFNFSPIFPSIESICIDLHRFKHIKYLNFSYLKGLSSDTCISALASTLTEFHFLERLVLNGLYLTGNLSKLFQEFCKKDHQKDTDSKCCILHNGTLKYLDISKCHLIGEDIGLLRELASNKSLRYLNISANSLEMRSTYEALLPLKSSLSVLVMDYCFDQIEYDPMAFPLGEFKELKHLSIKGLDMTIRSIHSLEYERLKVPKLTIIT